MGLARSQAICGIKWMVSAKMPNFNVDKTVINLPLGDGRLPLSYDDFVEIVYEII